MMGGGQGVKNESKIQALIPGPTKLQSRRNKEGKGAMSPRLKIMSGMNAYSNLLRQHTLKFYLAP